MDYIHEQQGCALAMTNHLTGKQYADLVAAYITNVYGDRQIQVYREVYIGKSIIGKNRRIDIFLHDECQKKALAIECKYQQTQGTADEKIPYSLEDIQTMWMPGCLVYAGEGFSEGVIHLLRSSYLAAYCFPDLHNIRPTSTTRELDHIMATVFGWWDVLIQNKSPFNLETWRSENDQSSLI
ncbi:MAG: PD-(D/E)XK nuclease superfamily protein, partial [Elainellaceae cyanobacterium]